MSHLAFQPPGPRVELEVDYVVVGSGAGGSPAAITLARAGFRVAVIEAGPWRDPEDYPHSMYGTMRDMFADFGQQVATGDSIIPVVQAKLVGGTTIINSAIVVRTPDDVLHDWDVRLGLGDTFSANAIGEAQDQIERELATRRVFQVERDAALVAVEVGEAGALAVDDRREVPRVVADLDRLDLDDFGAHVAQEHRADRSGDVVAQFQNLDAFERSGHRHILLQLLVRPLRRVRPVRIFAAWPTGANELFCSRT